MGKREQNTAAFRCGRLRDFRGLRDLAWSSIRTIRQPIFHCSLHQYTASSLSLPVSISLFLCLAITLISFIAGEEAIGKLISSFAARSIFPPARLMSISLWQSARIRSRSLAEDTRTDSLLERICNQRVRSLPPGGCMFSAQFILSTISTISGQSVFGRLLSLEQF